VLAAANDEQTIICKRMRAERCRSWPRLPLRLLSCGRLKTAIVALYGSPCAIDIAKRASRLPIMRFNGEYLPLALAILNKPPRTNERTR
jgi:hypothetical protein